MLIVMPKDLFDEGYNKVSIDKMVKLFKNKEMKIGDKLYCSKVCEDVILLDTPPYDKLCYYETQGVFPLELPFKTSDGKIRLAPIGCFTKISEENYEGYIEIEKYKKNKIDFLYYLARAEGFRAEKMFKNRICVIKIYGDSQQEVDRFLEDSKLTYRIYFRK